MVEKRTPSEHKEIHNLIILAESGLMEMIKRSVLDGFNSLAHEISSSGLEFKNQHIMFHSRRLMMARYR